MDRRWHFVVNLLPNRRRPRTCLPALLLYETLQADELEKLMKGESITRATVSGLLDEESDVGKTDETSKQTDPEESTGNEDAILDPA